ncbi:50S ribosomal protein L3 [Clostridiaceae bacterium HSG29]|nr:50S ribosomal protein L3 [Clostridiaceae bacterium HSG29]
MKSILGRKIGMTQVFNEDGRVIPTTVVEAGPIYVVQIKTVATDGYDAIQVGFGDMKEHRATKPRKGHFAKADVSVKKHLVEFKVENINEFSLGQVIKVDVLDNALKVNVTGTSKGKGTAGPIKRWNQSRGPETHGSHYHRRPGSIGQASYPGRVIKGMKMAGRMGHEQVTVKNLEVVKVDVERNLLLLKGAVPGPKKGLVSITVSKESK